MMMYPNQEIWGIQADLSWGVLAQLKTEKRMPFKIQFELR